jgi:type IV pilus assembly protein PilO
MATRTPTATLDVASRFETAVSQFRGLNRNDPGQWPMLPQVAVMRVLWLAVLHWLGWLLADGTPWTH